ncbi:MAG: two-component regulator propeller domain-containing protein, partial [Bacteroidales bacterium]|nr:two-component regulator propeller domain-containing protein [Bacteroidales bacterium]
QVNDPISGILPKDIVEDSNGELWIADNIRGMVRAVQPFLFYIYVPNGPSTINVFNMVIEERTLWVAPGALSSFWGKTYNDNGIFSLINGKWKVYNKWNHPGLDTVTDIVSIAIDPFDKTRVYAGSWDKGIVLFEAGVMKKIFNAENSALSVLEFPALGMFSIGVAGLCFDNDGNLWATNSGVSKNLVVRKRDGTWKAFNTNTPDMKMNENVQGKIVIDHFNQQWILIGRGNGIQVYNHNNTIDNTADDKVKHIGTTTGKGGLPSTLITDIAVARDGEIWIGSDKGIAVIYSPGNVFTSYNYDAQQILVEQDGYYQFLLESEYITAIAVDGANRKWIGTERAGVFLISPDGTKEILHFTSENSPLFSNAITSIAIDHNTGEVFFGTDKGIISYRGTATKAENIHSNVKVFPNPVHHEYTGPIAVSGLVEDALVRITNISGSVVYSDKADGGQLVWYGKDMDGRKVATGVYLVFSSNSDGTETMVAKILLIQ